jgi:LmbE family N-acetylglucosaminyl deacetylase
VDGLEPVIERLRPARGRRRLTVLCLGAHSDDIEIGCGGTILRLLRERPGTRIHWVVFSASGRRASEAQRSASLFLARAGAADVRLHAFRDAFFPHEGVALKQAFEALKPVAPDLIFTHCEHDRHQDHRTVCELTWNTFRDHLILEYEIPKFDADLRSPTVFVPLAPRDRRRKVALLMRTFPSQRRKSWFSPATFDGLMRLRGVECAAREGYAEAFYARKLVLEL